MDVDPRLAEIAAGANASDVRWLVAELTEARAQLEIVERRNGDLAEQLAERTRQLNGLLDAIGFDEKAVPA